MENCLSREGAIQVDEVSGSRGLKIVDERESEPGLFTYTADVAVKRVSTALDNFIYTREGRRGEERGGKGCEIFTASEEREGISEESVVFLYGISIFLVGEDELMLERFW